jgi:hypothetical protein
MHTGRLYIQLLIVLLGIAFHGYTQVDFRCATPLNLFLITLPKRSES